MAGLIQNQVSSLADPHPLHSFRRNAAATTAAGIRDRLFEHALKVCETKSQVDSALLLGDGPERKRIATRVLAEKM